MIIWNFLVKLLLERPDIKVGRRLQLNYSFKCHKICKCIKDAKCRIITMIFKDKWVIFVLQFLMNQFITGIILYFCKLQSIPLNPCSFMQINLFCKSPTRYISIVSFCVFIKNALKKWKRFIRAFRLNQ